MIFASPDVHDKGWFVVLQRVGGKWQDASGYKPYCTEMPKRAREQLFLAKKTEDFRPELAPPGETRC